MCVCSVNGCNPPTVWKEWSSGQLLETKARQPIGRAVANDEAALLRWSRHGLMGRVVQGTTSCRERTTCYGAASNTIRLIGRLHFVSIYVGRNR
jgi:hypothetical protein